MTTTELIGPPRTHVSAEPWSDARRNAPSAASADPTFGEMLDETLPLIEVVPVYGPPVVVLVGPWVLLSLLLVGPCALVFTFVLLLVAAAALAALIGAILAAPYLLVRHLRGYRAGHVPLRAPAVPLVARGSR
jgi:hypothetical protein